MDYYYLDNNILKRSGNIITVGNMIIANPTHEQYISAGHYPKATNVPTPEVKAGDRASITGWKLVNDEYVPEYTIVKDDVNLEHEYDRIAEDHLREARYARGYTTREPDAYLNSSNTRWSQDAKDWISFRDSVIEYTLSAINSIEDNPVDIESFRTGLPKITWTY